MLFKNLFKGRKKQTSSDIKPQAVTIGDAERPIELKKPGFLQGNLLVATNQVQDNSFGKSVIFMATHNDQGAMGLIINKELKSPSNIDILKELGINTGDLKALDLPVYYGGPVEPTRGFVLHSDEYKLKNTVTFENGIAITAEKKVLEDYIAGNGPKRLALIMGYAGWVKGQVELEINEGSWIYSTAGRELVFNMPNELKWRKAADVAGVDLFKLTPFIGNA